MWNLRCSCWRLFRPGCVCGDCGAWTRGWSVAVGGSRSGFCGAVGEAGGGWMSIRFLLRLRLLL